jgi:hypothetical protein
MTGITLCIACMNSCVCVCVCTIEWVIKWLVLGIPYLSHDEVRNGPQRAPPSNRHEGAHPIPGCRWNSLSALRSIALPWDRHHLNKLHAEHQVNGCIILWHIDPLLGNDRETNNETKVTARQQFRKYATVLELLLRSCLPAKMDVLLEAMFSMWFAPRLYHSTDQVELVSAVQLSTGKWSKLVGEQFSRCELLLLDVRSWDTGIFRESRVRGKSAVGSRYQTTIGEDIADWEELIRTVVNCSVCELSIPQ